jgi:hypothetical protein
MQRGTKRTGRAEQAGRPGEKAENRQAWEKIDRQPLDFKSIMLMQNREERISLDRLSEGKRGAALRAGDEPNSYRSWSRSFPGGIIKKAQGLPSLFHVATPFER